MTKSFIQKLTESIERNHSLLCLGLDPEIQKIPAEKFPATTEIRRLKNWCLDLIARTKDLVCCIKPNLAFFEQYGIEGLQVLKEILAAVPEELPILLDAKRGDIGSTAEAHARAIFDYWKADAVTASPYLGQDSIAPFLKHPGKMVFVLCKTSNPSAEEIQDHGNPEVFKLIAKQASGWGGMEQVGLVVGATKPEALEAVRSIAPESWILAPGVGAQGGDLRTALQAGLRADMSGVIVPVSRSIIFAEDPVRAAQDLRDEINGIRQEIKPRQSEIHTFPQRLLIDALFEAECVRFGDFTLASGKKSPIYIDLRRIISFPALFSRCISAYVSMSGHTSYDLISAVPYAALPIAAGIASELHMPLIYPRKEAKTHGTGQMVEGVFKPGDTALLIEDVITTGGSIVISIQTLKEAGVKVKDVLVLVDREQGGRKALSDEGVRLTAFVTLSQIVETLHLGGKIDEKTYTDVKEYLKTTNP